MGVGAMREGFPAVIEALWGSLDLAPPPVGAAERAVLRIDGRSVALTPSPDRAHLLIAAPIGMLATDAHRREEQMRRLMRDSLGLMLTNRAGLELTGGVGSAVRAVAIGPLRTKAVPLLRTLIEDVLHFAEMHAATLVPVSVGGRAVSADRPALAEGSLIFRL